MVIWLRRHIAMHTSRAIIYESRLFHILFLGKLTVISPAQTDLIKEEEIPLFFPLPATYHPIIIAGLSFYLN